MEIDITQASINDLTKALSLQRIFRRTLWYALDFCNMLVGGGQRIVSLYQQQMQRDSRLICAQSLGILTQSPVTVLFSLLQK